MNTVWLIISSVVVYLFYLKFIKPSFYWKQRGVFHVNPYSRLIRVFFSDKTFLDIIRNAYEEFPCKRYYGSFQFLRPSLLVRDLELAKKITIKDFDHFHDHFTLANDNDLVLSSNLFALKGEKWRDMRSTLSPAFSSSKMKQMFVLMTETAESFTDYLVASSENKPREYETKDLFTKYTNDVIASCAFGIKCDSLREDKNEFYKMGQNISNTFKRILSLKGLLNVFFPKLCQALGVGVFDDAVTRFFKRIVVDTISVREKGDVVRPDMIHLLMEARKGRLKYDGADIGTSGFATVDESNLMQSAKRKIDLTDDVITAQALIFFIAGFETSSTLLSFLSYELALNPAIQKHLQDEIDETMKLNGGQIKYDELLKMKYVDQVISETLRKYPPALALNRICTKIEEIYALLHCSTRYVRSQRMKKNIEVQEQLKIHVTKQVFQTMTTSKIHIP
ncbi:cytochrome P450 9e2-like isoform X2 [Cylas formicarius]|uniref:cytochrome P450 9e2-like isoform X2 n=1 Tax=Cylas formicarius TaxID=197179 RepID=UPI00295876AB|nr:cytochrome P450 9e2-like isoform X2 [Cylas formicarius]